MVMHSCACRSIYQRRARLCEAGVSPRLHALVGVEHAAEQYAKKPFHRRRRLPQRCTCHNGHAKNQKHVGKGS